MLYMRGSISQKDKNLEKSRKRGVVCLTKSAQPEPILVCFKFSSFQYSHWYMASHIHTGIGLIDGQLTLGPLRIFMTNV